MAPYYHDGQVTLYHGDSREILEWCMADVLVTDPPYGMGYRCGHRTESPIYDIAGDDTTATRDRVLEPWCFNEKPALIFGRWNIEPYPLAEEHARLIWHKAAGGPGMGDLTFPWGTNYEVIHVMGEGWVRRPDQKRHGAVYTTNEGRGSKGGDAYKYQHPTPKPVGLMEQLLRQCPDGTVADPFAGVGATLIAARNLGRKAIGVELEERYCETIARRLSEQTFDLEGL